MCISFLPAHLYTSRGKKKMQVASSQRWKRTPRVGECVCVALIKNVQGHEKESKRAKKKKSLEMKEKTGNWETCRRETPHQDGKTLNREDRPSKVELTALVSLFLGGHIFSLREQLHCLFPPIFSRLNLTVEFERNKRTRSKTISTSRV